MILSHKFAGESELLVSQTGVVPSTTYDAVHSQIGTAHSSVSCVIALEMSIIRDPLTTTKLTEALKAPIAPIERSALPQRSAARAESDKKEGKASESSSHGKVKIITVDQCDAVYADQEGMVSFHSFIESGGVSLKSQLSLMTFRFLRTRRSFR